MRCDVVEGEPGIFPEPITRFMRIIGGVFGGGKRRQPTEDQASTSEGVAGGEPAAADSPAPDDKP
jgi:hypothetical protein